MIDHSVSGRLTSMPGLANLLVRIAADNRRLQTIVLNAIMARRLAAHEAQSRVIDGQQVVVIPWPSWLRLRDSLSGALAPHEHEQLPLN